MTSEKTKKLVLTAIFVAIAVSGSTLSFPIFGSKCAPVQHLINVLSAVYLGPVWALLQAFCSATIRNLTGLGTLLAYPGSCFGALLSALLYKKTKHLFSAYAGEVFGTGILGGIAAYPIASLILGSKEAAVFTFVIPFLISTVAGTAIAAVVTLTIKSRADGRLGHL